MILHDGIGAWGAGKREWIFLVPVSTTLGVHAFTATGTIYANMRMVSLYEPC